MRPLVGFDTETNGAKFDGAVASVQFYFPETKERMFLPLKMEGLEEDSSLKNLSIVKEIIQKYAIVGHNLAFDINQLYKIGVDLNDIEIGGDSYILSAMAQIWHKKLKELVVKLGLVDPSAVKTFDFLVPHHDSTKMRFDDETFIDYACNDAQWAYEAEQFLRSKFQSTIPTYEEELRNIIAFNKMSIGGLKLDYTGFCTFRANYKYLNDSLKSDLVKIAGWDFRENSRADLIKIIHDQRGVPPSPIRTLKGEVSVSVDALEYLKGDEFVDKFIDYQHRNKVLLTLDTIERYLPDDQSQEKYLHPYYKIVGEDGTSRVYTADPSTNQLPAEFRNFIVAEGGKKFIYGDWKAAELMLAAYWAKEQWLIDAYEKGADLHRVISARLLDKDPETIDEKDREKSKIVTFSVMYGSEGAAASRALKISYNEATGLVSKFWEICPNIARLRQELIEFAKKTGYTKTITGRKRKLPGVFSKIEAEQKKAYRQVFNTAIQSSVADLQKKLIQVCTPILEENMNSRFATTVFDSFLLEVPRNLPICEAEQLLGSASHFNVCGIVVKLRLDVSEGSTFAEATGKTKV